MGELRAIEGGLRVRDKNARKRGQGGSGTSISYGLIEDLDPNTELRGDGWYGSPGRLGVAQKMILDADVRGANSAVANPVGAAVWDFESRSKKVPIANELADFCRYAFVDCHNWGELMTPACLGAQRSGFRLYEMTDDVAAVPTELFPNHPGNGLGIVPTGFHHRPENTIYGFEQSKRNPAELAAVTQWIQGSDGEEARLQRIDARRLIRLTWEQEGADFTGFSVNRSGHGDWKIKRAMTILNAIRHERQGVGVPRITLPEGADEDGPEAELARSILAELRSHERGYIVLPHGYEFKWEQVEGKGTAIQETIEAAKDGIWQNVLFGQLRLSQGSSTGSYALSSSYEGQAHLYVQRWARFIAARFQKSGLWSPVYRICALNYGEEIASKFLPRLVPRNLPTIDWPKRLQSLSNAAGTAGLITPDEPTEDMIREAFQLPAHHKPSARPRVFVEGKATDTSNESDDSSDDDDGQEDET